MNAIFLFALLLFASTSLGLCEEKKKTYPQPEGEPAYTRWADEWHFGCWMYSGNKFIHGRLMAKDGEIFGKKDGEEIKTSFGTLIWRGHYLKDKAPDKSTGWLFIESFSGPAFIRDRYNPTTGEIED